MNFLLPAFPSTHPIMPLFNEVSIIIFYFFIFLLKHHTPAGGISLTRVNEFGVGQLFLRSAAICSGY